MTSADEYLDQIDRQNEMSEQITKAHAEIERLRAALAPFHRYVEQNDLDKRDPGDAVEVPVINLLAASLAFTMSLK